MKKHFLSVVVILVGVLSITSINYAQMLSHGSWGISAVVNGAQADILFPIWTGNLNTIAPSIGVANIGGVNTDIAAGLVYHHYIAYTSNFAPIIGFRAGAIFGIPKVGTSTTDWIAGLLGGGEYFFSKNFSMGIEAQLNFDFSAKLSNRFGNPGGVNYNTGTVLFATVYF